MHARLRSCLFLILLSLTGCQEEPAHPPSDPVLEVVRVSLGTEFDLRFGQLARLDELGVTLGFQGVVEDSRCPMGVTCVWEGNGRVALDFRDGDDMLIESIELNTTLQPRSIVAAGWHVELMELRPWPVEDVQTPEEDYVASLVVSRP